MKHLRPFLVLFAAYAMATLPVEAGLPGEDILFLLQRPLRIRQGWGLYAGGPDEAMRVEVLVDDVLLYRSQDPDHTWRFPLFNHRRTKPPAIGFCQGETRGNQRGWKAYILRAARKDFPGARSVEVRCTRSPWPGDRPEVSRALVARSPRWAWRTP